MRSRTRAAAVPAALALLACAACVGPGAPGGSGPSGRAPAQLHVGSIPSGARIILDGKPTGFRTPTAFPAGPGEHRVTISLAGHRNAEFRVRLEPGVPQRVEARLTPLAVGSLRVASIPAGALVFIDGEPTGQGTPAAVENLAVGTHTVELRRPGSNDWVQAVVVTGDRVLALEAVLTPASHSLGALAVRSQPPNASIVVDGRPTGKRTPALIPGLAAGSRRVNLELPGYDPWSGTTVVREGQTESLLVTLRHRPAQEIGSARIETDPPGAAITLGEVVLRQKTPADLTRLAPGSFPLKLSRPGCQAWTGELSVAPGGHTKLEVRLEPEGRYGGSIRVESEPPGAAVTVDGKPTGAITPTLLPNLAPASHRVSLVLAGFRPWSQLIQVSEGTLQSVRARLVAHPCRITAAVISDDGGELALSFEAVATDGSPASGALELGATSAAGSWRERRAELVEGRARAALVLAAPVTQLSISVGLGAQWEVFELRRTPGGWSVVSP